MAQDKATDQGVMSRNENTMCAERSPISGWASGKKEFCIAWGCRWSEDLHSTWWALWSSTRRIGDRTEPGQASSAPGDTADICIYSPWAPRARWGEFPVKTRSCPVKFEPFFSINLLGVTVEEHNRCHQQARITFPCIVAWLQKN